MARTGLLIVTSLSKIAISLAAARKHVANTLYIQLYSPFHQTTRPVPIFSKAISTIYVSSLRYCHDLDVRVIVSSLKAKNTRKFQPTIDVVLFDNCIPATDNVDSSYATANVVQLAPAASPEEDRMATTESNDNCVKFDFDCTGTTEECAVYDSVVLGGTFDRLHIGHKILLTEAVLRARKRVVVGVTDVNMIKNKTLFELILPVHERIANVTEFLKTIDTSLEYEVVPIQDAFGPTKTDAELNVLIVSQETMRGGEKVNEVRRASGMEPLHVFCIDMIESEIDLDIKEAKLSSSNKRIDLLGTRLREPNLDVLSAVPPKPYVIGLIGGIASGKSTMAERMVAKGGHIIDCDKLAHQLYEPGQPCYERILSQFGSERVCGEDGRIDRQQLGRIVFGDPKELELLNGIVWPNLLQLAKEKIREVEDKVDVVFLEAAVLLKAGWQTECHEIWSLIVSPEIAIQRLIKRNGLSEEEALQRLKVQPDNATIVKHSNVVFCSQWSNEISQLQADRAWDGLMKHLKKIKKTNLQ